MTLRVPPTTLADKLLGLFGVERKLLPPDDAEEIRARCGEYVEISLIREGAWAALFRTVKAGLRRE